MGGSTPWRGTQAISSSGGDGSAEGSNSGQEEAGAGDEGSEDGLPAAGGKKGGSRGAKRSRHTRGLDVLNTMAAEARAAEAARQAGMKHFLEVEEQRLAVERLEAEQRLALEKAESETRLKREEEAARRAEEREERTLALQMRMCEVMQHHDAGASQPATAGRCWPLPGEAKPIVTDGVACYVRAADEVGAPSELWKGGGRA